MSEMITVFGENIEIEICPRCKGSGNSFVWSRGLQKHVEDKKFPCERCLGAKYIVLTKWKKSED